MATATMNSANQRVILARRPDGLPAPEDFALQRAGEPRSDGLLCETLYISLDPYLRGRLSGRHISGPIAPGEPMSSEMVLRAREDGNGFHAGDLVRAFGPWQRRVRLPVAALNPIPGNFEPPSLALGVLGMPGLTAYAGIERLLQPAQDEVLVVSAAAGPVGATVGQLAKTRGARTVGIAGSEAKCAWLLEQAGFDTAINYKTTPLGEALDTACPEGIDLYFDNVGGDVLQAVMERLAVNARVALCGLMNQYNSNQPPPGPNPALVIRARATLHGLVVYDHEDLRPRMESALQGMLEDGRLTFREDVAEGLDQAPAAFCRLMAGQNFGKTIVRV